jgi:1-acyl-sn-glycerol-3-phosphate acyltransferase
MSKLLLLFSSIGIVFFTLIYGTLWYLSLKFFQLLWWIARKPLPYGYTDAWATFWGRAQIFGAFFLNRTKIKITGDPRALEDKRPFIVIMNHQSTFDIAVAYYILHHLNHRTLRWVLKKELLHVPIIGTACKETRCAFVDRKDREKAKAELQRFTQQIRDEQISAVIFVEGTRATPQKLQRSDFKHLLNPKPLGLSLLHEQLPDWPILSVTIDWVGKTGTTIFNTSIWKATLRIDYKLYLPEEIDGDIGLWLTQKEWPRYEELIASWRKDAGLL